MKISKNLILRLLISCGIVLFLDQLTKIIVSIGLKLGQSFPLIPGVVSAVKVHNHGTIWGLSQGSNMVFAGLAIIIIIMVVVFIPKIVKDKWTSITIGMILGGALGNLIDRITRGFVVDFIHVDFFNFPVFNVADMGIVIAAILLVFIMFFMETKSEQN